MLHTFDRDPLSAVRHPSVSFPPHPQHRLPVDSFDTVTNEKTCMPRPVSLEDFAICFRQDQRKLVQRKALERRLHAIKVSLGVSARLIRIGSIVQRGLVDCLKRDDKFRFLSLYHTFQEIQESCDSALRRQLLDQDPASLEDLAPSLGQQPVPPCAADFLRRLSPMSRSDLCEMLQLVRSEPIFLFERLRNLAPAQLITLTTSLDIVDPVFSSSRLSQLSSSKRSISPLFSHKDYALAFERTDPLSTLLFNAFAAPVDSDVPEARLRLDVWSSVCAKLIEHGGSRYYTLIGHILSLWAMCGDWKARTRFELYLMDILQSGAFLLEHIDSPGVSLDHTAPDPLRTDVAEEFFASAVSALFHLLDDPDAGLPRAVTELGSAIFRKLANPEHRDRFLEYFFAQWFFARFLHGALTYPETNGLLLDFHVRKDAREKLLGQVAFRAYSQVFAELRPTSQFAVGPPDTRRIILNIISCFNRTTGYGATLEESSLHPSTANQGSPSAFLMLSSSDILTILNTTFPGDSSYSPPLSASEFPTSIELSHLEGVETGFSRARNNIPIGQFSNSRSTLSTDINFLSLSENYLSRSAERIRVELSDVSEANRSNLEHPSLEDWSLFSIAQDGRSLSCDFYADQSALNGVSVDSKPTLTAKDDNGILNTAIVKLIEENPAGDPLDKESRIIQQQSLPLKERFDRAMLRCRHNSDFIGAHYWWSASQQLLRSASNSSNSGDSWILEPMSLSCARSLDLSRSVIDQCEGHIARLDRTLHHLQKGVKDIMATVTKLRNKMWFLTDVKNSMRYEDAKNVALALKSMIYSSHPYNKVPDGRRSRRGRPLGDSLLQKPELQVMDVMKAASSQGGPNKLSDDQVDLTRKWLSHNSIDNFCKGEERIHRFCYEVKTSVNRLVGDTMTEAPVLWASELFQKERVKYEGGGRSILGLSSASSRPFSAAGDDAASCTSSLRVTDAHPRTSQDIPLLMRKTSFQSTASDKWRSPRGYTADVPLNENSPDKAASTATGYSCSTFWSALHQPAYYATSASSLYSRPSSMFGDAVLQSQRRDDRSAQEKQTFLDELRQTLTSLLLSDLGSPVWSCGSETDAWFANALDQKRIREQMERDARVQRFYDEYDGRISRPAAHLPSRQRSRSIGLSKRQAEPPVAANKQAFVFENGFSYEIAFRRLIEVFSRHGSPFVKLKALRDLRTLVIASISSDNSSDPADVFPQSITAYLQRRRHSFSSLREATDRVQKSTPEGLVAAELTVAEHQSSECSQPTDSEIVSVLKQLLLEVRPRTLFRDLQFISAFVPSDTLNKTDNGAAFLQFGLAALGLKDEVCNSMVEIADAIVSRELSRRRPHPTHDIHAHHDYAIEDAAGMWIITAKEGNPVAQRELAILYLTHPELVPRVTLPLTRPRDTFKAEMMYRRDKDSKTDPRSMCLALHWMRLSAKGGDELARNRLREREEFDSIA